MSIRVTVVIIDMKYKYIEKLVVICRFINFNNMDCAKAALSCRDHKYKDHSLLVRQATKKRYVSNDIQ